MCSARIISLFVSAVVSLAVYGQENISSDKNINDPVDYKTGVGIRLGSGLSVKQFTSHSLAIEGILGYGYNTLMVGGLLEKHFILGTPRLKWFFGPGGHVGLFRYRGYYYWAYEVSTRVFYVPTDTDKVIAVGGVDFILGLEYKFRNAPFNAGIDVKPFIDFYKGTNIFFDGALTLRCAF